MGFPGGLDSKESACSVRDLGLIGKIPWRREGLPTPIFLSGEFHGQATAHGVAKSDTTE